MIDRLTIQDGFYSKGYKFKIYPNEEQKIFLEKCMNHTRFVFNWALQKQKDHFEEYKLGKYERKFYSQFELQMELTKLRHNPDYDWLLEVPNETLRGAIRCLNKGITLACSKNSNCRFPNFKKKKYYRQSFLTRNDRMYIRNGQLRIEGLPPGDLIDLKTNVTFDNIEDKIYNPVISNDNLDQYWISFTIVDKKEHIPGITFKDNVIGIDLNVRDRFVCSNGYRSGSPDISYYKHLRSKWNVKYEKDLERKKQWEITNPEETYVESRRERYRAKRYRRIRKKIAYVVENFIHNETLKIIRMNPSMIVMEKLDNISMQSRHHVAKYTMESAFYKCRKIMEDKCNKYSIPFMLAPKAYPSSQICSNCGNRTNMGSKRIYECPYCGLVMDRDLNAAINLKKLAFTD